MDLVSIPAFLVLITILVFIHEFGHFWVARKCGVKVMTFSVGFGPELFGMTDRHGTRWKFAAIPLGGYVKMYGDGNAASADAIDPDDPARDIDNPEAAFRTKTVWQRFAIVAAGPLANFLLAIVLITGLFSVFGQPYAPARVNSVVEGSPAEVAGFLPDDLITAVDGKQIDSFDELRRTVQLGDGSAFVFTVLRDGSTLELTVVPEVIRGTDPQGRETVRYQIGIGSVSLERRQLGFVEAFNASLVEIWSVTTGSFKAVKQIIEGFRPASDLGGPIRIAQISGEAAQNGLPSYIWTMALLSISLGVLNLLPIPVLDGGHLLFYIIEIVKGSPLSLKTQEYCFRIGLALVLSLMVFVTWNDTFYTFLTN
ncbi:RIP metalloprotease RseP [Kiloniella sp. b19]|uniref:RIP metalloprotease RseP n=1 Tax=Kiloniella sp. GXU_MW_B19 TaxID=3141326 RepID=UPI0031DB8725